MIDFIWTLAYSCCCMSAGLLLLRAWKVGGRTWHLGARSAVALIVGQALLSVVWTLAGLAGLMRGSVVASLVLALLAAGLPSLVRELRPAATWSRAASRNWGTRPLTERLLLLGVAIVAMGFGSEAWLTPPIGDAEAFYSTYARIIAATHVLRPMPGLYESFSSVGLMGELHMAALITVAGTPAGKFFNWVIAVAAAAVFVDIGRLTGLRRPGQILLLVMLLTTTAFTSHSWDGKVDLYAAALGLVAVWCVLLANRQLSLSRLYALAGLVTGFAIVAKFPYAVGFVPAIGTLLIWPLIARERVRQSKDVLLALICFGFTAVLATLPHLLKNGVLFGAPFAPFLGVDKDQHWASQVWFTSEVTHRILMTYPFALVFGNYPMQGGNLSFLWLAFLPLAFWLGRARDWRSNVAVRIFVAGAVGTAAWMIACPSVLAPRYLLATLLLLFPLAASGAEAVLVASGRMRWIATILLAVTAICLGDTAVRSVRPVIAAAKDLRVDGALDPCFRGSSSCKPLGKLSREAAAGDRVYFAGYYAYWLRSDLLLCRDHGQETHRMLLLKGAGLDWDFLREHGFSWLVIEKSSHMNELKHLLAQPRPANTSLDMVAESPDVAVYRITMPNMSRECDVRQRSAWPPR